MAVGGGVDDELRVREVGDGYFDNLARSGGSAAPSVLIAQRRAAAPARSRLLGLPRPKPAAALGEAFVHHQELRHHLEQPRPVPQDRLVIILDYAKDAGFPLGVKKCIVGLRFSATDMDWSTGTGSRCRRARATAGRLAR